MTTMRPCDLPCDLTTVALLLQEIEMLLFPIYPRKVIKRRRDPFLSGYRGAFLLGMLASFLISAITCHGARTDPIAWLNNTPIASLLSDLVLNLTASHLRHP